MLQPSILHASPDRAPPAVATERATLYAALAAGLGGLALLWAVGFSDIEILHNVAHDTRHSNVFPCH
ncbi:MAG: CbtB-domain containing protein [Gammaproteobacteria bacterium]|nr:CbtB-domain containing protein [Gammaproteobacteria bacterium]